MRRVLSEGAHNLERVERTHRTARTHREKREKEKERIHTLVLYWSSWVAFNSWA
jgi:hypothetical protein